MSIVPRRTILKLVEHSLRQYHAVKIDQSFRKTVTALQLGLTQPLVSIGQKPAYSTGVLRKS